MNRFKPLWQLCLPLLVAVFTAASADAQLAPAGSVYVQQPAGVHYFIGTTGAQTDGGFYYVNYLSSQFDVVAPIRVAPNGSFSGISGITGRSLAGQVSGTSVTFTYNGITITSPKETTYGPTQPFAGGYQGSVNEPSLGVYVASAAVTRHGVILATAINNSSVSVGVGTIDTGGNLFIRTLAGEQLTGKLAPANGLAQGVLQSNLGYQYSYVFARTGSAHLANISTRGVVGTGEQVLIGGFSVKDGGKTVLIDAKGPSLTPFGVQNAVQNPRVDLYLGNRVIASNRNWRDNGNSAEIAASGVGPTDDREAALLVSLEPGNYTVIVSSEDASQQGVGIVEVYDTQ